MQDAVNCQAVVRYSLELGKLAARRYWMLRYWKRKEVCLSLVFVGLLTIFAARSDVSAWTALTIGLWILGFWLLRLLIYLASLQQTCVRIGKLPPEGVSVQMADDTIRISSPLGANEWKWPAITQILEYPEMWIFIGQSGVLFYLPKDQLPLEMQSIIRNWMGEKAGSHMKGDAKA